MKFDSKLVKSLALALSLPGLIFTTAYLLMKLAFAGYINKTIAVIIFILIISNTIFLIVYFGYKDKNKL